MHWWGQSPTGLLTSPEALIWINLHWDPSLQHRVLLGKLQSFTLAGHPSLFLVTQESVALSSKPCILSWLHSAFFILTVTHCRCPFRHLTNDSPLSRQLTPFYYLETDTFPAPCFEHLLVWAHLVQSLIHYSIFLLICDNMDMNIESIWAVDTWNHLYMTVVIENALRADWSSSKSYWGIVSSVLSSIKGRSLRGFPFSSSSFFHLTSNFILQQRRHVELWLRQYSNVSIWILLYHCFD